MLRIYSIFNHFWCILICQGKGLSLLIQLLIMSDSLQLNGLQHARTPCLSPTPRLYSNSRPMSWWCHPTISSSFTPFVSYPQSFSGLGSFPMNRLFVSSGQSIGASASTSVLPMNIQDWLPLGWPVESPWVQGTLKSLLQHHIWKGSILWCSAFFMVQLSHSYMITGKTTALTR